LYFHYSTNFLFVNTFFKIFFKNIFLRGKKFAHYIIVKGKKFFKLSKIFYKKSGKKHKKGSKVDKLGQKNIFFESLFQLSVITKQIVLLGV